MKLLFHTERHVDGTVERVAAGVLEVVLGAGSNKFAIYVLDEHANAFFQFAASDARGTVVRAEVTSNRFLATGRRLDAAAEGYLAGLGWSPPTEGHSPNWHREMTVDSEDDARRLAREAFRALEVYGWRAGDRLHETLTRERPDDVEVLAPGDGAVPDEEQEADRYAGVAWQPGSEDCGHERPCVDAGPHGYEGMPYENGLITVLRCLSPGLTLWVDALVTDGVGRAYLVAYGPPLGPRRGEWPRAQLTCGPMAWDDVVSALLGSGFATLEHEYVHPGITQALCASLDSRRPR